MTVIPLPAKKTMLLLSHKEKLYKQWQYARKKFLNSLTPKQKEMQTRADNLFEEYTNSSKELNKFIAGVEDD